MIRLRDLNNKPAVHVNVLTALFCMFGIFNVGGDLSISPNVMVGCNTPVASSTDLTSIE